MATVAGLDFCCTGSPVSGTTERCGEGEGWANGAVTTGVAVTGIVATSSATEDKGSSSGSGIAASWSGVCGTFAPPSGGKILPTGKVVALSRLAAGISETIDNGSSIHNWMQSEPLH